MQIYSGVFTIPATGTTSPTIFSPNSRPIPTNFSVTPANDQTTLAILPYGDMYICTPGSPTNVPGVAATGFSLTGTPGDTVSIAVYYPERIEAPLVNIMASVSGTVKTDVGQGTAPDPNINLQADATGIAAAVNNQTSNFPTNRLPKATDGGVLTGTT